MTKSRDVGQRALLLIGLAAVAAGGCRDDVAPFSAGDRRLPAEQVAFRLTFNPGDDRTPTWSSDGDSIYYAAGGFDLFSDQANVLVGQPRLGGVARPITTNVQVPGTIERWLIAPEVAPSGERFVYAELGPPWPEVCPGTPVSCNPAVNDASLPRLRVIILRVRRFDATGSAEGDPALTVAIPGVVYDFNILNTPRTHVVHNYPFHQLFDQEGTSVFRPSWAPDGARVVYSDGLQLLIWNVGDDEPQPIPNSSEGVSPAWSPDGALIAFTRLERADSSATTCVYVRGFVAFCVQERTNYLQGRRILSLIRPDGSGLTELGDGEDPAWSSDGAMLLFRRDDRIWMGEADGRNAVPLSFSEGGREPAISPDGLHLAFSKLSQRGDYDIWVISFELLP